MPPLIILVSRNFCLRTRANQSGPGPLPQPPRTARPGPHKLIAMQED
jgi:hypothetical protein